MRFWGFAAAIAVCALAAAVPARAQTPADTLRLSADEAVRFALRDGVEAAIARQDVEAAAAQVGVALSYALPQIDVAGTYVRNLKKPVLFFELEPGNVQSFELGQDNAWFGGISLRQTVWASGRVRSGYNMAKERAVAAEMSGDAAAAAIARDVRSAYYLAVLAKEQEEIARRSLEQAQRQVAQITSRVKRGVSPEFDRLRSEVTVANRRPQYTRAQNTSVIALESLKRYLGMPLDRSIILTDGLEYVPYDDDLDSVIERALSGRRDLAAARSAAIAAEHQAKAQSANGMPLLYLDGNVQWQGETSRGLWPDDNESASSAGVGLTFAWPLIDGFRNKNETRTARALAERARLQVKQAEDVVRLEVRSGYSDVQSIAEEIEGAEHAVSVAREAYQIAQVRYDKGMSTLIELLDSELAMIEATLNLSVTLYRYNVAVAVLSYNVGEGPRLELNHGEQ